MSLKKYMTWKEALIALGDQDQTLILSLSVHVYTYPTVSSICGSIIRLSSLLPSKI